jgi:hypothetical protein
MHMGQIIIGYSFAGDSIPYIDTQSLQKAYFNASPSEKAAALAALTKKVMGGPWWGPYVGQVMGNVKALCQQGHKVTMVGIQGGPITQVEQAEMVKVKINIEADLRSSLLGLKPEIELDLGLESYSRFEEKYNLRMAKPAAPSAPSSEKWTTSQKINATEAARNIDQTFLATLAEPTVQVWRTVLIPCVHPASCRYGVLYSYPVYILQVWCTHTLCTSCRYGVLYSYRVYAYFTSAGMYYTCTLCILSVWHTILYTHTLYPGDFFQGLPPAEKDGADGVCS